MIHSDDLYEHLRKACSCLYGSDLRIEPHRSIAAEQLVAMELTGYPVKILSEMANYLFDDQPHFKDAVDAKRYFEMKLHRTEKKPKKLSFFGKE